MNKFLRLLTWNLRSWWRGWQILLALALFASVGISSAGEVRANADLPDKNVWHAVLLAFSGPAVWGSSLSCALRWLVPHLVFFYIAGPFAQHELQSRGYAVVPFVGSRQSWWWGKVSALLLSTAIYTLSWFLIVFTGATFLLPISWTPRPFWNSGAAWPFPSEVTSIHLAVWILALYGSTLFTMSLVQTALSLWWRHSFHAYVVVSTVFILSWLLGIDRPGLARWLPGSQSILSRHTFLDASVPAFSFEWSLAYNGMILLATLALSICGVRRLDIFGYPSGDVR